MSRQSFGIKNTKISLIFYVILLILTFFSRKIFIDALGTEIVGLSSAMLNILNIINLSELGVGTAIATTLYKPLYDKDNSKISDIISILGYFYRIIGFVVIGIGVLLLVAMPFLFSDKGVEMHWVYMAFGAMFLSNLVPYFISYEQTILTADQRYYEIAAATNITVILRVVVQVILLKVFDLGYGWWLVCEAVSAILLGIWLVHRVKTLYPKLNSSWVRGKNIRKTYPEIFVKARQIIPHRISSSVLNQTDNILLLILTSLESITLYTNYSLLMSKSVALVSNSFNGLIAGVGNLIAQGNMDSIKKLFWEFNALFFVISSVLAIGFYHLSSPFVGLWLGGEFVLGTDIVILLSVNAFLSIMRLPLIYFTNGYSLFKDTWAPCVEALINLVFSFAFGYFYGIMGVMLGTAISLSFMQVWKPYFFYSEIFKISVLNYWKELLKYIIVFVFVWLVIDLFSEFLFSKLPLESFFIWIIDAVIICVMALFMFVAILYKLSSGMRNVTDRFISILR